MGSVGWHGRVRGMFLIEALIAILIFAVGILGFVGMQSVAVAQSAQGQHRTTASLLANSLIGQMWVANRSSAATLASEFASPSGSVYTAWMEQVSAALPGVEAPAQGEISTLPTVTIDDQMIATVSIFWRIPGEPRLEPPRQHIVSVQLR